MGRGEGHVHGAQHVGGLQRSGSTSRARRGTDVEFVQHEQDRFALHELEGDAGGVGQALGRVAVDDGVGDAADQFALQPVAQGFDPDVLFIQFGRGQFGGFAQADDGGHVLGAAAAAVLLVAAEQEGRKLGALAHVEGADALGAMQFVSRQGKHIDLVVGHVDGQFAHGLHRVGVENRATLAHLGRDLFHRKDHAGFIVGPHEADDGRVVAQVFVKIIQVQAPFLVDRYEGHAVAVARQVFGQVFDGRMLDLGGNDMALFGIGAQRGPDGRAVALGAAGSVDDLFGMGTDQFGQLGARLAHLLAHVAAEGVHARRVAVELGEVGQHLFHHLGGDLGGGVVIQVDGFHAVTSSTTRSLATSSLSLDST